MIRKNRPDGVGENLKTAPHAGGAVLASHGSPKPSLPLGLTAQGATAS